jgi:hypothetical protein
MNIKIEMLSSCVMDVCFKCCETYKIPMLINIKYEDKYRIMKKQ